MPLDRLGPCGAGLSYAAGTIGVAVALHRGADRGLWIRLMQSFRLPCSAALSRAHTIGGHVKTTQQLHDLGQSLWLDNITRSLLADGTLRRYIADLSVTGLTSNPTIFDEAIKKSSAYDDAIERKTAAGGSGEGLFFDLALEDLTQAADLFRPIHDANRRGGRLGVA